MEILVTKYWWQGTGRVGVHRPVCTGRTGGTEARGQGGGEAVKGVSEFLQPCWKGSGGGRD